MEVVYLHNLAIENYRNFTNFTTDCGLGVNVIIGHNGVGKTNILESISYLSPGKGLRSSNFDSVCKLGTQAWSTNFKLKSKLGLAEISSTYTLDNGTRSILYNGSKIASSELSNLLNIIWLTPQMEGLFLGPTIERRRFIDRIVYSFETDHARNIIKYNHYMKERNKILASNNIYSHNSLLASLEQHMAKEAFKIASKRREVINHIQRAMDSLKTKFPKATLYMSPLFKEEEQGDNFESMYMRLLQDNRQKDFYSKRTDFGVHRSDLHILYKDKKQIAKLCSTGEQKALLVSIVLATIESILHDAHGSLILLLDELFVHLDDFRKNILTRYIKERNLQTFITTTDIYGIEELVSDAHIIQL